MTPLRWWPPSGLLVLALVVPLAACAGPMAAKGGKPVLIIAGLEDKITFSAEGTRVNRAPGGDSVVVIDIGSDPESPKIVATLPLMNTIVGPPTNLQISPDARLALVANSIGWEQDGAAWKSPPDNKVYVIDLTASPAKHVATVEVGKQPSGLSIGPRGDLALVANRADKSISVLAIDGMQVKLIDTVGMGDEVAGVTITPDGKRALAWKFPAHKVALLEIDGRKVTYNKYDMNVGLWPYNVVVTPNGKLALVNNNGNAGSADGQIDTVSVIDLEASPPRVIDYVTVGDGLEGMAMSPRGDIAISVVLGSLIKSVWHYKPNGAAAVLRIDGKKVTKVKEVQLGGLPEGIVFSPDGRYIYVGNFTTRDISILRVDGSDVVDTGKRMKLPGQPASMRGGTW